MCSIFTKHRHTMKNERSRPFSLPSPRRWPSRFRPAVDAVQTLKGIEGKEAPLLEVDNWIQTPEGKDRVEITDYPGKIVVLLFFQHWCRASQESELPVLKETRRSLPGQQGIVFIAVQTTFEGFLENTSDNARGDGEEVRSRYPLWSQPETRGSPQRQCRLSAGRHTPWWVIIDRKQGGVQRPHPERGRGHQGFDKMLAGLP